MKKSEHFEIKPDLDRLFSVWPGIKSLTCIVLFAALFLLLVSTPVLALMPVPIADIYVKTEGANPNPGVALDGYFYFSVQTNQSEGFYRVPINAEDETETELILEGIYPSQYVIAGSLLFFRENNNELWVSDGTAAGTRNIRTFYDNGPEEMVAVGSQLFFSASSSSGYGRELWRSDGTSSGTIMLDIYPGSGEARPMFLTSAGNNLFFLAYDGSESNLWMSDGVGVTEVTGINLSGGAFPRNITAYGNEVVMVAYDGSSDGLWRTDGTTHTLLASPDLSSGINISNNDDITVVGNRIFFTGNKGSTGSELFASDGTPGGTDLVFDIKAGNDGSYPRNLTAVGSNLLFFTADNGLLGRELWVSNATTPATTWLEIVEGAGAPDTIDSLIDLDGSHLLFRADDGTGFGAEPWISDGMAGAGTHMILDLFPGINGGMGDPVVAAQGIAFFPSDALDSGNELWRSNGSSAGTIRVTDIGKGTEGSQIDQIVEMNGAGYFFAEDGFHGRELWRTDGTTLGTTLVQDLRPDSAGGDDDILIVMDGWLYFYGDDGTNQGLWKSNGAPNSATFVKSVSIDQPVVNGSVLYFEGDDGSGSGEELWRSDGSTGGTYMVLDAYPGTLPVNIIDLTVFNGNLYFGGRTGTTSNFELWRSNGTSAGTIVLKDIIPGDSGSFPGKFKATSNLLYFIAYDSSGKEVWTSDGTAPNTQRLKDINPGSESSVSDPYFTQLGAWVYFVANDGTNGQELWRSDGTEGNTVMFSNINPASGHGSPDYLTVAGDKLYFTANNGTDQKEPWVTDGITTMMVKDIHPDFGSSPRSFFATGNGSEVYFSAYSVIGGSDADGFWRSDGTEAGTHLMAKLNPSSFSKIGSQILFRAETSMSGEELWSFGEADCGDALDPEFPTLLSSGGACHRVDSSVISPILGAARDIDIDGQPTADSDGDDVSGLDDEDGVSFSSPFALGEQATMDVTLSESGILNVWFDWMGNGNWNETEDWVFNNLELSAGTHTLSVNVPTSLSEGSINVGSINVRFRVSTKVLGTPDGITFDGEVEDHQVTLVDTLDFGDAPDPAYPTLLANDGARHRITSGYFLGTVIDAENDGQPTAAADGDVFGLDDEDGVTFIDALYPGSTSEISIEASGDGYLYAWIDFNSDGDWDDKYEQIIYDDYINTGSNSRSFSVPTSVVKGPTYARFRFDSDGYGYLPTGFAPDGEVEDYLVNITGTLPTSISIDNVTPISPSFLGVPVQVSFTLSGSGTPTGIVSIDDGNDSCIATLPETSCAITFTSAGVKSVMANYSGDVNFQSSTSSAVSHIVDTDLDEDGIADSWEMNYFGDTSTANDVSDFEKDGYSDLQEYLNSVAGETDPDGAQYSPKIANAPGGNGYTDNKNDDGFWNLMLPAILGGKK